MRNYWAATIWMWISDLSFALAFDFLITNYTSHDKVFYKASTVMTFLVKSKCAIISIALFCKKKLKFSYSMSPNPRFFNELFKKIPSLEIGHDVNKTDRDTSDKMAHGAEDLHSRPLASPVANFQKVPLLLFRILKS